MSEPLAPLPLDAWDPALDHIAADMKGAPINVHKLMAHNPALLKAWWDFRNYSVNGGTLGPRLGELVILRVGVQLCAWYEWGSHVDRSLRCGLTLDEINAVLQRDTTGFSPAERALLQAVDALIEQHEIPTALLGRLSDHFETPQIMDIIAIHGMYVILGCMIRTWGLALDEAVNARIEQHTTPEGFEVAARGFHQKTE